MCLESHLELTLVGHKRRTQGGVVMYEGNEHGLTHVGSSGEAQMVDISTKDISLRTATANCKVMLGKKVFDMVHENHIAKGDVLTVAKIAGISGAKQTRNLIPLCHNILLTHVDVELKLNTQDYIVEIKAVASCSGKTGVEMEAMTAVGIASLTVYDMCKAASKGIQISHVRLRDQNRWEKWELVQEGPILLDCSPSREYCLVFTLFLWLVSSWWIKRLIG